MRFLPILLGLSALVSARCGSKANEAVHARHRAFRQQEETEGRETRSLFETTIRTYFHVIEGNRGSNISWAPAIAAQMDVLNTHYEGTGFGFDLVNISYTRNSKWVGVVYESQQEYEMKSSLRRGSYRDLNIYIDTIRDETGAGGILGYATFPEANVTPRQFRIDGVVLDPNTLPGGVAPYDLGITAVHEVGHWLNLLHTFQPEGHFNLPNPGCFGEGDYIFDTPAEGSPAFGCPRIRDTCRGFKNETSNTYSRPGPDPIHNFMDYTDDACLNNFTPGQIRRMHTSWPDRAFPSSGLFGRRLARPGTWPPH